MQKVDVFGTYHVDRPSKVTAELCEFSSESDVLFSEQPRTEVSESDERNLLLRNPTMWIAGTLLNIIWDTIGLLLTRQADPVDSVATERASTQHGIEIEPVDMNLPKRAASVGLPLTVFSWLWSILAAVLLIHSVNIWSPFWAVSSVTVSFFPLVPFAYLTLSERDSEMARNIETALAERDDISRGCLVVGHKHMDGVVEELGESSVSVGKTHKSEFFRRSL